MNKKLLFILLYALSQSVTLFGADSPSNFDDPEITAATAFLKQQESINRLSKRKTEERRRAKSTSPSVTPPHSPTRPQIQKHPLRSGPYSPTRPGRRTPSPYTLTPPSSKEPTPQVGGSPETIIEEIVHLPKSSQRRIRAISPLIRTSLPSLQQGRNVQKDKDEALLTYLTQKMASTPPKKEDIDTVEIPSPEAVFVISGKPDNTRTTSVTQRSGGRLSPIHKLSTHEEEEEVVAKTEKKVFDAGPYPPSIDRTPESKNLTFRRRSNVRRNTFAPLSSGKPGKPVSMFDLPSLSEQIEEEAVEEVRSIFDSPKSTGKKSDIVITMGPIESDSDSDNNDNEYGADIPAWQGAAQRAREEAEQRKEEERRARIIKNHSFITLPRARKELQEITISKRKPKITFAPENSLEKVHEYEPTFNEMEDMHGLFKKSESGKPEISKPWIERLGQY